MQRRNFLQAVGGGTVAALLAEAAASDTLSQPAPEQTRAMTTEQLRQQLVDCLGGPWPPPGPLRPLTGNTIRRDGYRIESVSYEVEPGDRVQALLLVPDGASSDKPAPAIAVWHQHAGQFHLGKSEPAGLAGDPMHHTGVALVREGYVVLCPDALCFETRQDPRGNLEGMQYERFQFLYYVVHGKCLAWKNILDMRRGIDYLVTRPEVNPNRIGCYGHSMGSTHSWLVAPHEPRIRAAAGNCCLPTYEGIHDSGLLHCFSNFIPGWLQYGDTPEIASLIAPRPLHLNFGETDEGCPIEATKRGIRRIEQSYLREQAARQFTHFIQPATGHVLTNEMWRKVREFFARSL